MTGLNILLNSLQTLDLNGCRKLRNQGLDEIISLTGGELIYLDLSRTDVTMEELARQAAVKLANIKVRVLDWRYSSP